MTKQNNTFAKVVSFILAIIMFVSAAPTQREFYAAALGTLRNTQTYTYTEGGVTVKAKVGKGSMFVLEEQPEAKRDDTVSGSAIEESDSVRNAETKKYKNFNNKREDPLYTGRVFPWKKIFVKSL